MSAENQRNSNIELFRIVMMLLIVAHHYVVNSGLMETIAQAPFCFKSAVLLVFGAWGKVGINGFVLITGFYMCKSRITAKKYLKLLAEIEFYKLLIYIVFLVFGVERFGFGGLLRAILPVRVVSYEFVDCFLVFYLFIPFANLLVASMDQKRHLLLLVLLFGVYTCIGSIPHFTVVTFNYMTWFAVIYFLGAYLRLYTSGERKYAGLKFFLSVLAAGTSVVGLAILKAKVNLSIARYFFVNDSNKILAVIPAYYGFRFFSNLKLGYRKTVNTIASATFGVLLIHANNDTMRIWLWNTVLRNAEAFFQPWWLAHAILSVFLVYTVCTLTDLVRIRFLEQPFLAWYDKRKERFEAAIQQKVDRIVGTIAK